MIRVDYRFHDAEDDKPSPWYHYPTNHLTINSSLDLLVKGFLLWPSIDSLMVKYSDGSSMELRKEEQ